MDFSYAQGSVKYRQLLRNDIVAIFLDADLVIKHISSNNDLLGVPAGTFSRELPISRFMPEAAAAEVKQFVSGGERQTVIAYDFIVSDDRRIPVRHNFFLFGDGFCDGIAIHSYISMAGEADALISEYETALKYICLISGLPVGVFTHDGGKITYANRMLGALLGTSATELIGMPIGKYFSGDAVKPGFKQSGSFTAKAERKDGGGFSVNVYNTADGEEPDFYTATVEDAASYRSREHADGVLRRVFEHTAEGVMLLDPGHNITWVNPGLTQLMESGEEDVVGRAISEFQSGEHTPEFYSAIWNTVDSTGFYKGVVILRKPGGELMPVMVVVTPVRGEEGISTYIIMLSQAPDTVRRHEIPRDADALTGLRDRGYFETQLEIKLAECRANDRVLAVLLFDIDRFNTIDEMYGRECGDVLLKQLAVRFERIVPEGTVTARMGGDEFAAIIEEPAVLEDMDGFCKRFLETMTRTFFVLSSEIDIDISAAVVFSGDNNPTPESIMRSISQALSVPKLDWRSSYRIVGGASSADDNLEERLRNAIIKNEFELYYLPKLNTETGKIVGMEALARWNSPDMGMVSPGAFIPLAEGTGLISSLGNIIFNMACMQLQKWHRKGFDRLRISVNISSLQLRNEELADELIGIMTHYGISPEFIELDFAEDIAFEERSVALGVLSRLAEAGATIALDDFGTGYSSIKLLKKYPIGVLKIDRSLIKGLAEGGDDEAVVLAMVALARSLGMKTVAEGVETLAQFERITEIGCNEMQGYFIGKPAPPETIEELLRSYEE